MKRLLLFIIPCLFLINKAGAQSSDTLTNSAILKMVNARLSDELIIDVIGSSAVNFDLSPGSIDDLIRQNVSKPVIEAMKKSSGTKGTAVPSRPDTGETLTSAKAGDPAAAVAEARPKVIAQPAPANISFADNEAFGYVTPVADLISFHEKEIEKFMASVDEWSRRINDLTASAKKLEEEIRATEKELMELKNADSKSYSGNILAIRKKLNEQRKALENARAEIVKAGEKSASELEKISKESIKTAGNKYSDVSQDIKSFDPEPSGFVKGTPVKQTALNISENINPFFTPALEIPAWHKNKIREAEKVISQWNEKVKAAVTKAGEIDGKMAPLKQKLAEYQTDQKKNKNEIATLKKQISAVEKEKKSLIDSIEADSRELAGFYKQENSDIQKILDQRFADIIENINYAFKTNSIL